MKVAFMKTHSLTEKDWNNLVRYEKARKSGKMNMFEYRKFMREFNVNGGKKLATWILTNDNYFDFLEVLENERNK